MTPEEILEKLKDKRREVHTALYSYDDKRYLGNWMLDNELTLEVDDSYDELSGELNFDTKTSYMDGVEVFHNNKY